MIVAVRSADADGWVVTFPDLPRLLYADRGGAWLLLPNGDVGRQVRGTSDVRAPRSARALERFLRARHDLDSSETIEVRSPVGRPARDAKAASEVLKIRVTDEERDAFAAAAGEQPVSAWLRDLGRKAAKLR